MHAGTAAVRFEAHQLLSIPAWKVRVQHANGELLSIRPIRCIHRARMGSDDVGKNAKPAFVEIRGSINAHVGAIVYHKTYQDERGHDH